MTRDIVQKVLPFKLEEGDRDDEVTGLAGLPIIHQFMKRSGLCRQIKKRLNLKECGWSETELVETIVLLVAAGGEHLDDVRMLATDTGRLSSSIMEWIQALPEVEWKPLQMVTKDGMRESGREWAEMPWSSAQGSQDEIRNRVLRTVITRKKAKQWEIFKDEHSDAAEKERYEVIATNRNWEGDRLIRWHYERGGSIEHVHDRVKNDLAGHVLPCAEFGANAAWWRLQCLALNIIRAMQIEILPEEFRECHLKRLRFHLFCIAGRVIRHARELILKLSRGHPSFAMYRDALTKISSPAFS